jgi:beta-lactamase regulating signal transducer with metallopeptidase domain
MTPVSAIQSASSFLMQLANPAARALALAGAAGLGLALLRVTNTSVRLFTWTAVLYAATAMPFLAWMLPPLAVPMPAFLQHEVAQTLPDEGGVSQSVAESSVSNSEGNSSGGIMKSVSSSSPEVAQTASTSRRFTIRWSMLAAGIYFAVASLLLVRLFVGLAFARRLMGASRRIEDSRVTDRLASRAHASGRNVVPRALESEFISVPVTMGALRSAILLPTRWSEWDDAKLDAVVAHEMSHVARRDALTQRLSLLHRAIFWFSPLAWWLDRHLADLAEEASDEAALSCGADCRDYARTLLGFFETLHATPGRVWWQGVSMAKAGQAEQRVERILAWKGNAAMSLKRSIAAAVIVFAIPVAYLAASVNPATGNPVPQNLNFLPGQGQDQAATETQTAPPAAQTQAAPAARSTTTRRHSSGKGSSYSYGYDDDQRFVIVSGQSDSLTMSGSTEDATHAEKLRKQIPGDFIWFERDEKSYVIRDQATIDRARKFWAPQEELGKKQEELGKQQEILGEQQEALGTQMEQVHINVPDMTAELDALKAKLKQLNSGATMDQVGQIQSEIGDLQSKIGELQSQAGEQQSKLGEQQGALGEKQGKLGEQQGELGRQQGELARKAAHEMKQLLDEAIKSGKAQPEI